MRLIRVFRNQMYEAINEYDDEGRPYRSTALNTERQRIDIVNMYPTADRALHSGRESEELE